MTSSRKSRLLILGATAALVFSMLLVIAIGTMIGFLSDVKKPPIIQYVDRPAMTNSSRASPITSAP